MPRYRFAPIAFAWGLCALVTLNGPSVQAGAQAAKPGARATQSNANNLGLTCAQILDMTSADWVAKFSANKGTGDPQTIQAIEAYGKCYDARTASLAAGLAKSGKGPLMAARSDFRDFEQALDEFTAKALADSQPPADPVKKAYATLYEKQFRYEFYESYQPKPVAPPAAPSPIATSMASGEEPTGAASKPPDNSAIATAAKTDTDADPVTLAKNHFGELLGDLPDENVHQLHAAFGDILGVYATASAMQLRVYRYAIFLLEPPSNQPFAPPPF